MGGVTVLLAATIVGVGAGTFGRRFRTYSLATMATVLVGGAATFGYVGRMIDQKPTPWLGILERMTLYAFLLWIGVLAAAVRRRVREHR
jgi:ABC-type transport system involved in cytochrome c biogenesis permease subunit